MTDVGCLLCFCSSDEEGQEQSLSRGHPHPRGAQGCSTGKKCVESYKKQQSLTLRSLISSTACHCLTPSSSSVLTSRKEFRSNQRKPAACKCHSTGQQEVDTLTHTQTQTHRYMQTSISLPLYFKREDKTHDVQFKLRSGACVTVLV